MNEDEELQQETQNQTCWLRHGYNALSVLWFITGMGFLIVGIRFRLERLGSPEGKFRSHFERVHPDCIVQTSRSWSTDFRCNDNQFQSGKCRCIRTDYYIYTFTVAPSYIDENGLALSAGGNGYEYTSIEVPRSRRAKNCNWGDPLPPMWNEGDKVKCWAPKSPDNFPTADYSCGNANCIRLYERPTYYILEKALLICATVLLSVNLLFSCWYIRRGHHRPRLKS